MPSHTFYDELMFVISTLRDRPRQVILRRLGFNGRVDSLASIGIDLFVTRERVRQIEATCLRTINESCGVALTKKLKKRLARRSNPLLLDSLELEDQWFFGFSDKPVFLAQVIEKLTKYHVLKIKGQQVITKTHYEQWKRLKFETLVHFRSQVKAKLSLKEVKQQIRNQAARFDATDLADSLQEFLTDKLRFASPKGKGPKVLCSVGRGLSSLLEALLVEATEPLHYTELAKKCSARLGRPVEGYVHNSLKGIAYLYGRGVYGTLEHFPIGNNERKNILAATESIISEGPIGRQWACSELLSILLIRKPYLSKKWDKYMLDIILTSSTVLKSVGRLVWILTSQTDQRKVCRVDLQDIVRTIVENAGRPISLHEIKKLIKKNRGLDEHFTILPTAWIARVKPNVWGLIDRDFFVTKAQRRKILDTLEKWLKKHQEGLHITELKKLLSKARIKVPLQFTDYMVLSLSQTDSRFKVRRGKIVGLSEWPDGKRVTIKEAIERLAEQVRVPMTLLEVQNSVAEIVKHEVKQPLHRLLEGANFVFDEESNTWYVRE
jgi:hypothetical protein